MLRKPCYPLSILLLSSVFLLCHEGCDSFLPQRATFRNIANNPTVWFQQQQHRLAIPGTALSMGFVDDLVEKTDKKSRIAGNEKYLAKLQKRVERINSLEESIEDLDDDELQSKTQLFRQRLQSGEDINGPLLEEAFAVVREAAW